MSLIFNRMISDNMLEIESGVVCGEEFINANNVRNYNYADVNEVYDISINEAVNYLGCKRGKTGGFEFINRLWLKRAVHAGLLHGAIYKTGDYYFSLYELGKLRDNINFYGGIDPLDKEAVNEYFLNLAPEARMLRQGAGRYDKQFYQAMTGCDLNKLELR